MPSGSADPDASNVHVGPMHVADNAATGGCIGIDGHGQGSRRAGIIGDGQRDDVTSSNRIHVMGRRSGATGPIAELPRMARNRAIGIRRA